MALRAMFVDFNAYFATVEQQVNPSLRGRPLVVAAVAADSTCCIAASYEAKRFGIRTGTPVGEARRLCKSIRVVVARPELYVQVHHRILAAIDTCIPIDGVHSIDEVSCRLALAEQEPLAAVALAKRVKRAVLDRVGECMTCSIGLAPNRQLAKVATDMQKPDGLVVLDGTNLPEALFRLQLDDLAGIGKRMRARLNAAGVTNVRQLYAQSEAQLRAVWGGVVGQRWWYWLRGHELDEPRAGPRSSLGHSHVLPPALRDDASARAVLVRLIHKAAARLRRAEYWAQHLSVYVSYTFREEGWHGSVSLGLCQDTLTMIEAFGALWPTRPRIGRPTQVGVTLHGLVPHASAEVPMFAFDRRRVELSQLLDRVTARHGSNGLYFAGMHGMLDTAPTRIAFGHIPDTFDACAD